MPKKLIISDPKIMMGKPVISGTRIMVEMILEKLSSGETVEQILEAHQRLTNEAIRASLAFAALRTNPISWSNSRKERGDSC